MEDQKISTFVFGIDAGGVTPRALGCGSTVEEGMRDALARLAERYRGKPPAACAALMKALQDGCAAALASVPGGYPRPSQMGHDYLSNETHELAVTFSNDLDVLRQVRAVGKDPTRLQQTLERLTRAYLRKFKSDMVLALVDWSEVADDCLEMVVVEAPFAATPAEPAPRGREIAADVLEVLAACSVDGQRVKLPPRRLERKLYERVDEVLRALGGRWVGGKTQAHVFEDEPAAVLEVAVATASYVKPQDFGYFPTPPELVRRLVDLAELQPGMRVLEPSAGKGDIAIAAAAIVGFGNVDVCELLPGNLRKLREAGFANPMEGDFLAREPQPLYDRILMNPPFSGLADVRHVQHAARFLKPDGRLVAITAPSWTYVGSRAASEFRQLMEDCDAQVEEVAAGAFRASGTDVATRIITLDAESLPWNRRVLERQRA